MDGSTLLKFFTTDTMRSLTRFLSRKPPAPYALTAHRAISTPRFDTCTCNKSVRARQRERKRKKEREKETRNTKGGEKCVRFFDPVFSGQKKSTRITTNARMVGTTPVPIASRFDSELFASRRFTFSRRYKWCVCVRACVCACMRVYMRLCSLVHSLINSKNNHKGGGACPPLRRRRRRCGCFCC